MTLSVERGGEAKTFAVTPRLGSGGTYQIGLWLRDAVRGLGTVTFYDPATGEYGALGHGVGLPETRRADERLRRGDLPGGRHRRRYGRAGHAGELCGGASSASPIGSIEENTVRGIFGTSGRRSHASGHAGRRGERDPSRARRRSSPPSVPAACDRMTP